MTTAQFNKQEPSVKRLSSIEPVVHAIETNQLVAKSETETTFVTDVQDGPRTVCITVGEPNLETITSTDIKAVTWETFIEQSPYEQATIIADESLVVTPPEWWTDVTKTALQVFNNTTSAAVLAEDTETFIQQSKLPAEYQQAQSVQKRQPVQLRDDETQPLKPGQIYFSGSSGSATVFTPHQTASAYKWTLDSVRIEYKNISRMKKMPVEQKGRVSRDTLERYKSSGTVWIQREDPPEDVREYTVGFMKVTEDPLNGFYAQRKWNDIHVEFDSRWRRVGHNLLAIGDFLHRTRSKLA